MEVRGEVPAVEGLEGEASGAEDGGWVELSGSLGFILSWIGVWRGDTGFNFAIIDSLGNEDSLTLVNLSFRLLGDWFIYSGDMELTW